MEIFPMIFYGAYHAPDFVDNVLVGIIQGGANENDLSDDICSWVFFNHGSGDERNEWGVKKSGAGS